VGRGYVREVESCSNKENFPNFYVSIPVEALGSGECAFYYPPDSVGSMPED